MLVDRKLSFDSELTTLRIEHVSPLESDLAQTTSNSQHHHQHRTKVLPSTYNPLRNPLRIIFTIIVDNNEIPAQNPRLMFNPNRPLTEVTKIQLPSQSSTIHTTTNTRTYCLSTDSESPHRIPNTIPNMYQDPSNTYLRNLLFR